MTHETCSHYIQLTKYCQQCDLDGDNYPPQIHLERALDALQYLLTPGVTHIKPLEKAIEIDTALATLRQAIEERGKA